MERPFRVLPVATLRSARPSGRAAAAVAAAAAGAPKCKKIVFAGADAPTVGFAEVPAAAVAAAAETIGISVMLSLS